MPKRIPQISEAITGRETTQDYLEMQKRIGRFYLKDVLNILVGLNKRGSFLEIGPGPGYQTVLIAEKFPDVTIKALEYSADMILTAREYAKSQQVDHRVEFLHGSVEDANLLSGLGKFDLVYSTFSLHHWPDPRAALANLYGVVKKNGIIFIYDFIRGGLFYHFFPRKGTWESMRASYTPDEIGKILGELNITNYKIQTKYPYMSTIIQK